MKTIQTKIQRNLVIFTLVVLLSGWVGQGLNILLGMPSEESLGMLLWLLAPFLATLLLRAYGGDGWKNMGLRPLFQINVKWYIFSILVFPILTILVIISGISLGWISLEGLDVRLYLHVFLLALAPNFFKNILEEFVWRGYLTPQLASLKINDGVLYLIVGLIWGLWHIPYYLFFLDTETLKSFTELNLWTFIGVSILTMIAWTIVFVEIWFLTRSVWPAVLMHMMEDSFINPLLLNAHFKISSGKEIWIHPVVGICSIGLYLIVGLGLRKVRRKKEFSAL